VTIVVTYIIKDIDQSMITLYTVIEKNHIESIHLTKGKSQQSLALDNYEIPLGRDGIITQIRFSFTLPIQQSYFWFLGVTFTLVFGTSYASLGMSSLGPHLREYWKVFFISIPMKIYPLL
jgi:hypothetical protein